MPFTFFDHTGDIGVRLSGSTLEELFQSAASAFTETIAEPSRIERRQAVSLAIESSAADLLLVDWLDEILYRFEVDQFLVAAAEVHASSPESGHGHPSAPVAIRATLLGETFDPARHRIKVLVKAITYHALEVRETADGWHGTVVFDI